MMDQYRAAGIEMNSSGLASFSTTKVRPENMSIPRSKFDKIQPVVCRVLTHDDDQSEQAELLVGVFKRGTESLEARDVSAQTEYSEGRVKKLWSFR